MSYPNPEWNKAEVAMTTAVDASKLHPQFLDLKSERHPPFWFVSHPDSELVYLSRTGKWQLTTGTEHGGDGGRFPTKEDANIAIRLMAGR